jgi:ribosomal protein L7/L12
MVSGSTFLFAVFAALIVGILLGVGLANSSNKKALSSGTGSGRARAGTRSDITSKNKILVTSAEEIPQEVLDLLPYKIEALKLLREMSGLGLKEAKNLLDAYERLPLKAAQAAARASAGVKITVTRAEEIPPEILALIPTKKIEAIKLLRDRTGLGLKESKDLIDEAGRKKLR